MSGEASNLKERRGGMWMNLPWEAPHSRLSPPRRDPHRCLADTLPSSHLDAFPSLPPD